MITILKYMKLFFGVTLWQTEENIGNSLRGFFLSIQYRFLECYYDPGPGLNK